MTLAKTALLSATTFITAAAAAQPTVDYTTSAWKDFGNSDVAGLFGNFLPGWEGIQGSPDFGTTTLFGIPVTTLSGAADDAAIYMNQFDATNASNEVARLSLSGFSIGQVYSLDFYATIVNAGMFAGWTGSTDQIEVAITGTTSSSFQTTVLTDAVSDDGLNTWDAQSIVFTAMDSTVTFTFGAGAITGDTSISRLGIDGFDIRVVPSPAASAMLMGGGLLIGRRRR